MHWSFWFAAKWRGMSLLVISIALFGGVMVVKVLSQDAIQRQIQLANSHQQQVIRQQLLLRQEHALWQKKKSLLQQGLHYVASEKTPSLAGLLQTWQEQEPQRQWQFEIEPLDKGSIWFDPIVQHAHHLQIQFWVSDENDLTHMWEQKKRLPCLPFMQAAQLSRAQEGGLWIEEDIVCIQF